VSVSVFARIFALPQCWFGPTTFSDVICKRWSSRDLMTNPLAAATGMVCLTPKTGQAEMAEFCGYYFRCSSPLERASMCRMKESWGKVSR
jgi:hypothetical protein